MTFSHKSQVKVKSVLIGTKSSYKSVLIGTNISQMS